MSLSSMVDATRLRTAPRGAWLGSLALVLAAGATGCFRATGIARPTVAVEEIAPEGGDRVRGLKATAGPGDFYLGNDHVQMAVDGAAFGFREGQFGAASGGAVLDIGSVELDNSYHRVSPPSDLLERLGPVANQDPDLPLVFDQYLPTSTSGNVTLEMRGYLLDPKGKLGAATDAQGRVAGVTAVHKITLEKADAFFTLETTLTNQGGSALALRNVGDHLSQHGAGYRFLVPAYAAFDGTPTQAWGADIPGTDFSAPLTNSVQAGMVALMGNESAGSTYDYHASLGILPLTSDSVLVASDRQSALTEPRPVVPARLVVGSPAVASLAAGQSLTYKRRLYVAGGASGSAFTPAQATTLFNAMASGRSVLNGSKVGVLYYSVLGTAVNDGPLPAEFRFERYTYSGPVTTFDPSDPANPASQASNWKLERLEWREPQDVPPSSYGSNALVLPSVPDAAATGYQRYRIWARNANQASTPIYLGTNLFDSTRPDVPSPISVTSDLTWNLAERLAPERDSVLNSNGKVVSVQYYGHSFSNRQFGTTEYGGMNPARITLAGVEGTPDPFSKRVRFLNSVYNRLVKDKLSAGVNYGAYQYRAGNQVFGTSFSVNTLGGAVPGFWLKPGSYLAFSTRGPLSYLDTLPVLAGPTQALTSHAFVTAPPALPSGWTAFDVPGPTQASTGGYNPGELLSSALAEGVQVVARTEEDLHTDPAALRTEFRTEIDSLAVTDAQRAAIGSDPFIVGARSAALGDGFVTGLFTPAPNAERFGGARASKGWTLADFLTQSEAGFTIVHRPRGPQGLFTVRGFDRTAALGTGANAWWTQTGTLSLGKRQGDFDALELLRGEGLDPADPTAWFTEFKAVRADWFALLNQQKPGAFTKALGCSSARYSFDTPVGLARTYLKHSGTLTQDGLSPLLAALQSGAAVASTGPLLDVAVGATGPGGLVAGPVSSVTLTLSLHAPDWVPVDEVRVVVNGAVVQTVPLSSFTWSATDFTLRTATVTVPMPGTTKDAWLVVEAGVPLTTSGAYRAGTPWNKIMRGIYPVAVTNPIFIDVNGGGYTAPGL